MNRRRGFSWIELVFLLVLIATVLALFLLRAGSSRESARRMECENRLRGIFLAMQSYSLQYGHFPIGTQNPTGPIRSEPSGYHQNWISGVLPQLNEQSLYETIDFDFGVYDEANRAVGSQPLEQLRCASTGDSLAENATSYVGMSSSTESPISVDGDGMLILNRPLSSADVLDGENYVLMIGEKSIDFGPPLAWNSGTRASLRTGGLRINAPPPATVDPLVVGGLSSNHAGGAYGLTVGGEFRFLTDQMDPVLLQQLIDRADAAGADEENTNENETR
ncbi:MAG: DUF1559 domain-containing protein [Planctomycetota bacterium]